MELDVRFMGQLNWMDILVIVVIMIFAIEGLVKGLVLSLFHTLGFFGAYVVSKYTSEFITAYICSNTYIDDALNNWLADNMKANLLSVSNFYAVDVYRAGSDLCRTLILITTFILVFVCAKMLINILGECLNLAARFPVIKHFNGIGGLFFGTIKGAFIIYMGFALAAYVIPFMDSENILIQGLKTSKFAVNFYTYNFIIPWIEGMT